MLIVLGIVFAIGYWIGKDTTKNPRLDQSYWLQRIINALVYTAQEELDQAKSKTTKAALQRVIDAGYNEQYGYAPGATEQQPSSAAAPVQQETYAQPAAAATAQPHEYVQGPNLVQQAPSKQDLDNTSLLLYFGAFLFITSIGLFVAFSDIDGSLRTFLVALVAFVMYMFGFWLHQNKAKLEEVGLTFIGIGMSALPFIGVAAYYYVYDEQYGPAIWMLTSLFTVGAYMLTLFKIRNTFLSYMLIASVVSLFESSVSVLEAPAYYYVWMLIVVGIFLRFISLFTVKLPELKDSSAQSAQILIPLTMGASFLIAGSEGTWQLAVSLALGAMYYGMQIITAEKDKELYTVATHLLVIGAVAVGAFSVDESIADVARVLLMVTAAHTILIAALPSKLGVIAQRFIDISLITAGATVLAGVTDSLHLTIGFVLGIVMGVIVTVKTKRHDSFALTAAAWVIFSVIAGQVYPDESISNVAQVILTFSFAIPILVLMHAKPFTNMPQQWMETLRVSLVSLHVLSMLFAFLQGEYAVLVVSLAAVANVLIISETLRERAWANLAVAYSLVPSVYVVIAASDDYLRGLPLFTLSVLAGLAVNIGVSLRHKLEASRWASSAGWLALPFALGIEEIGDFDLSASLQMWLYLAAAIALSVSRAIARGRIMITKQVPLDSLDKNSSAAYALGLIAATSTAIVLAFASQATTAESTIVIALAGAILVVGGTIIEREPQFISTTPFLAQVALLRLLEPYDSNSWLADHDNLIHVYVFLSSALALSVYAWTATARWTDQNREILASLRDASIITLFIAPLSFVIFGDVVWAMPVTLFVASLALLHQQRTSEIGKKEGVGFLALASVFWLMYILGVRNPQAYTHVLALVFAAYGYMRYIRKDQIMANNYWGYMLGVATIPLALQALSSDPDSGIYGIWLLLENVFFFLVGITVRNKLITRWGLYMATASVLYQLRGLGWAMLSVLALVLIGIGAYRALNQPDEPEK